MHKTNSDELVIIVCIFLACSERQLQCSDGSCIDRNKQCDGVDDCADGLDEHNCSSQPGKNSAGIGGYR